MLVPTARSALIATLLMPASGQAASFPSGVPTGSPTFIPTEQPLFHPTGEPTFSPSQLAAPSGEPTMYPTSPTHSNMFSSNDSYWITTPCGGYSSPVSVQPNYFNCQNTSTDAGPSSQRRYRNYSGDNPAYPLGHISIGTAFFSTDNCTGAMSDRSSTDYPLYCQGNNTYAYNASASLPPLSDYYGVVYEISGSNCSESAATSLQLIQVSAMLACHLDTDFDAYVRILSCSQSSSEWFTYQAELYSSTDSTCTGTHTTVTQNVSSVCSPVNATFSPLSYERRTCTHVGILGTPSPTMAPYFLIEPQYWISSSCAEYPLDYRNPQFAQFHFFDCVNTSTGTSNSSKRRDLGSDYYYSSQEFITVYTLNYSTDDCTGPYGILSIDNTTYPRYCLPGLSVYYYPVFPFSGDLLQFPYVYSLTYEYGVGGCLDSDVVGVYLYYQYTFKACRYDATYGADVMALSCNQTSSSSIEYTLELYSSNDSTCTGTFSTVTQNRTATCVANNVSSLSIAYQRELCLYEPSPTLLPTSVPTLAPSYTPSFIPTSIPTWLPSSTPSAVPTILPTEAPTLNPSSSPSSLPTFLPSSVPSGIPSNAPSAIPSSTPTSRPPSFSPSFIPTNIPTWLPSSTPSAVPTILPSEAPTLNPSSSPSSSPLSDTLVPSGIPTSIPTFYPSIKTAIPSGIPTSGPTYYPSFSPSNATLVPSIILSVYPSHIPSRFPSSSEFAPTYTPSTFAPSLNPTINVSSFLVPPSLKITNAHATNASVTVSVNISSKVGVNLFCAAFQGKYVITSQYQIGVGSPVSVPPLSSNAEYSVTSLSALQQYDIYCFVQTWSGTPMPFSDVLKSKTTISTSCCKGLTFLSAPTFIDPRVASILSRVFVFGLSAAPSSDIAVTPIMSINGALELTISPKAFLFSSNATRLAASFVVSGFQAGHYNISLSISGSSAKEFLPSVISFQILSYDAPFPAPFLVSATFASDGGSATVSFSGATNQGGISSSQWPCYRIFNFTSVTSCTCSWINSSFVKIFFPTLSELPLLAPGDFLTLLDSVLTASCTTGAVCLNSTRQAVQALSPLSPIAPVVVFNLPAVASTCDDLTIDASPSYGNGGRNYQYISWALSSTTTSANISKIIALLPNTTHLLSAPVTVPKNLLTAGTVTLTLHLRNFLGQSGASTAIIDIIAGEAIPAVSILGSHSVTITPNSMLSIQTKTTPSSCASSSIVTYTWHVYLSGVLQRMSSTSLSPSIFRANPYTFQVGNYYDILVNASTPGGSYATSSMQVFVASGQIVAIISGSSSVSVAVDRPLGIDASASYDENSLYSNLTFAWLCEIVSEINYGSECLFFSGLITNTSILEIPKLSFTLNVSYSFTVTVKANDGRYASTTVTVVSAPPGAPVAQVTFPTNTHYNVKDTLAITGTILSDVPSTAYWSITNTGPAYNLSASALTPIYREFSYYAPSGISYPLVLAPFTTGAGVTYTVTLNVYVTSNPQLVTSASAVITISAPPASGTLIASPLAGESLITHFILSAPGW